MSLDVASLVTGLHDLAGFMGPSSLRLKLRLEDYVKSYYFDAEEDLLRWARARRKELSLAQLTAVVDVGMFGQSVQGKRRARDVKLEMEKVWSRPPSPNAAAGARGAAG
jgi:hypothetical protein